jgi:2-dehydro-3-deoxyphosphogluconate aldolase/(4S)-4-hydroxy-2-oxoglutarate aldolase
MSPASKQEVLTALRTSGIVAVIRTENPKDLVAVSRALGEGGVQFVEVTMTIQGAIGLIGEMVTQLKDSNVFVGAGTVLDAATAGAVIDAGAHFVVGPGYDPEVVKLCNAKGVLVIQGALTPNEIIAAWKGGTDVVKLFPANLGGPDYIRALKEPLPQIEILPTKGVDFETAEAYLRAGSIAVGVGGALVSKAMISGRDYATITKNAERFSRIVQEARAKKP